MNIIRLKYGNTNTYLVNGLLIDTDMAGAGAMAGLRRELKKTGVSRDGVGYVIATHYHPDHAGLIGGLQSEGVKLILPEWQREYVHFPDGIFARDKRPGFVPVNESRATVVSAEESRVFLAKIGIGGVIVPTRSHSPDGAALILDDGNAFVGDLEPFDFIGGYEDNVALREDWDTVLRLGATVIHYGHANEQRIKR